MEPFYIEEITKTKILVGNTYQNLETEYTEFLENNAGSKILDLQFSMAGGGRGSTVETLVITFRDLSPSKEKENILGDL